MLLALLPLQPLLALVLPPRLLLMCVPLLMSLVWLLLSVHPPLPQRLLAAARC